MPRRSRRAAFYGGSHERRIAEIAAEEGVDLTYGEVFSADHIAPPPPEEEETPQKKPEKLASEDVFRCRRPDEIRNPPQS